MRISRVALAVAGAFGLGLLLPPGVTPGAAPAARRLTLLTSSSIDGELQPCGCKLNPRGGLSRRAYYYGEARKKYPASLTLDAGDFGRSPEEFEGRGVSLFTATLLGKLRYDAWTPGERELYHGPEALAEFGRALGAPAVSANLVDTRDRLVFPDRLLRTVDGVRVGITGVTAPDLFNMLATETNRGLAAWRLREPLAALRPVVADLRGKCDLVIVLAHLPTADAKQLAEQVPGIDVIVAGHNPPFQNGPDHAGNVLIMNGGNRGHYASRLTLDFDATGARVGQNGLSEALSVELPADVGISAEIEAFQAGLDKRQEEAERTQRLNADGGQGKDRFLGDETCARCHSDVYTRWAYTAHADAYRTLMTAGRARDKACLPCHTVGFGQADGFKVAAPGGSPADSAASNRFRHVQCESCHGRGTLHGGPGFVARPGRDACVTCHDAKNDPKRNFEKALTTGVHPRR